MQGLLVDTDDIIRGWNTIIEVLTEIITSLPVFTYYVLLLSIYWNGQ